MSAEDFETVRRALRNIDQNYNASEELAALARIERGMATLVDLKTKLEGLAVELTNDRDGWEARAAVLEAQNLELRADRQALAERVREACAKEGRDEAWIQFHDEQGADTVRWRVEKVDLTPMLEVEP